MAEAKQIGQAVMKLTGIEETPTRTRPPVILKRWAEWFGLQLLDEEIERMVRVSAEWARDVRDGEKPRWLSLLGSSGTGKTHIAKCLWNWLSKKDDFEDKAEYVPQWIYWPKLVEDLRSGSAYNRYRDMMRWKYLVLDEVCAENQTEFSTEKLHNLLGSRVGRWTIVTSNKRAVDIATLDRRIASRMARGGSYVVDIRTKDYSLR
jgi:DNA replication protein DnaC